MQATDRTPAPAPGKAQQKNITNPLIKIKMEHTQPSQAVQDDYDFCTAKARAALKAADNADKCTQCGLTFDEASDQCDRCFTRGADFYDEEGQPAETPAAPFGQMSACSPSGCDRPGGCWCKVQDFSRAAQPFKPNFNLG